MGWEEGEQYYIYESNGGCEGCDAMAGIHMEEPEPPHPYCACFWYEVEPGFEWDYEVLDVDIHDDGRMDWEIRLDILCLDTGEEFSRDCTFGFEYGYGYPEDDVEWIEERATAFAEEYCGLSCLVEICW